MNDQPDTAVVEMLVELACRAPSVHNSQPWRWIYSEHVLDLYTDSSRVLGAIDPTERQMVMSCGAALDHLQKAAAANRWTAEIDLLPTPGAPDHLARVRFVHDAHPRSHEFDLLTAINRRYSDRRAFGPVPSNRDLTRYLGQEHYGTEMTVLSAESKETLAKASTLSASVRKYDATYQAEIRWWAGHAFRSGGIPPEALTNRADASRVQVGRVFPEPHRVAATVTHEPVEDESTVVLLETSSDEHLDWLQSGRAMSAFLLAATADGLATCPLTHMTEQSGSRRLVESLAARTGVAQVLIRVGKPMIGSPPPRTPRHAVASVLSAPARATNRRRS
ncbi:MULTISPECIES: Acg family FMN-binding oxidoreductase [Rhodococcus]|uniref:Nitroreductase family protein n=1 Tax=Rhodococcus cerastii TaxID=908616 RepID=A0ABU4D4I5_9NOCA|nr:MULTISPECIES: nitroreductase family protein [Rhodococcus]MDV6304202.1 nitroreductase family protein [Rhodococcus cerastii]MDV7989999.1 nitroreductase family protein [Rhodococcus sp. IEGM 1374]